MNHLKWSVWPYFSKPLKRVFKGSFYQNANLLKYDRNYRSMKVYGTGHSVWRSNATTEHDCINYYLSSSSSSSATSPDPAPEVRHRHGQHHLHGRPHLPGAIGQALPWEIQWKVSRDSNWGPSNPQHTLNAGKQRRGLNRKGWNSWKTGEQTMSLCMMWPQTPHR